MDSFRSSDPLNLNGLDFDSYDDQGQGRHGQGANDKNKKPKDYKLVADPLLQQGANKVYRFEGVDSQDPTPVIVRDPRSRIKRFWSKRDPCDLPIPKFKFDQHYVGKILPKEVTFSNLNDNISQNFLKSMVQSFGNVEDVKIYFHPTTKKHLGIGKVLFTSTRSAKVCAEKLNQTSKMGMIITVQVDLMGKERQKMVEEMTKDRHKKTFRPPSPPPPEKNYKDPRARHSFDKGPIGPRTPAQPEQYSQNHPEYGEVMSERSFPNTPHTPNTPFQPPVGEGSNDRWGWQQQQQQHGEFYDTPGSGDSRYAENSHRKEKYRERRDSDHTGRSGSKLRDRGEYERGYHREDRHSRHGRHKESRHHKERREHHRRDKDRGYNDYDNGGRGGGHHHTEHEQYDEEQYMHESLPPPEPEPVLPPQPDTPPTDGPREESLDSRIALLLGGALPFGSPERESADAPPLPEEPAPPLPYAPAPPLPDELCPPPLPPEPDHGGFNGHHHMGLPGPPLSDNQDDRMSLSSVSSGEEKIEVNPPLQPDMSVPPPALSWQHQQQQQDYQNQMVNNMYNNYLQQDVMMPEDQKNELFFTTTLEKVIDQLKEILGKDLGKKVIQNTAFKAFDQWWVESQKNLQAKAVRPASPTVPEILPSASTAPIVVPNKPVPALSSLDTLFDKDRGGGPGMGGFLGLRGGVPKMPSFRKKYVRPPSPPPEEEEEEEESRPFRGPRTPEESEESGDDKDLQPRRKKNNIYSSESEDESEDGSSESEDDSEDEEDDDEEEDEEMGSEQEDTQSEVSDIEVPSEKEDEEETAAKAKKVEESDLQTEDDQSHLSPINEDDESKDVDIFSTDESRDPEKSKPSSPAKQKSKEKAAEDKLDSTLEDGELDTEDTEASSKEESSASVAVAAAAKAAANIDAGREEDAAMALLQMHDTKVPPPPPPAVIPPVPKTPERTDEPPEYSCILEHNYFMKGTPKKGGRPRKDSGIFEEIPGLVLNGAEAGATGKKSSDETDSASEGEPELVPTLPPLISLDHQYCQQYQPVQQKPARKGKSNDLMAVTNENQAPISMEIGAETEVLATIAPPKRGRKRKISDVTNFAGSRELAALLPPPKPKIKFKPRNLQEEIEVAYSFLMKGIDPEDMEFLRKRYEELLNDDSPQTFWLNDTRWVDHSPTLIPDPPKKKKKSDELRRHKSGSARTEGYYKISFKDKHLYLSDARGVQAYHNTEHNEVTVEEQVNARQKKKIEQSREARSESRRWQNVLTSMGEDVGDLLKFNQLKFRKKQLNFSKSGIHDWGLFALEPIAAEEMVIEYVGAVVRQSVADLREKRYEQMGIGSSYMFRIDAETIIDATKCGNLARFINHCCNPNCYAKIISVEGAKKIVIYSKRDIGVNEEITYDYKFPLEDEKIVCLCGAQGCRGFLN